MFNTHALIIIGFIASFGIGWFLAAEYYRCRIKGNLSRMHTCLSKIKDSGPSIYLQISQLKREIDQVAKRLNYRRFK